MVIRIGFSIRVIRSTFSSLPSSPLSGLAPDNDILFLLLTGGVTCQLSEMYLYQWSALVHLVIGVVVGVMVVVAVIVKEDFILAFIVDKFKTVTGKHSAADLLDDDDETEAFQDEATTARDNFEKSKTD